MIVRPVVSSLRFFKLNGNFVVETEMLEIVDDEPSLRLHSSAHTSFNDVAEVVDSCIWHFTSR